MVNKKRTGRKRKFKPSPYDRVQDRKIRKLTMAQEKKSDTEAINLARTAAQADWVFTSINQVAAGETVGTRDGNDMILVPPLS